MENTAPQFKNHFPSNTAILIVVLFCIALIGAWYFYTQKLAPMSPSPTPTPSPLESIRVVTPTETPMPILEATESAAPLVDTRFTGTIVENDPGCYVDGICSITVGNTKIILESGGERMNQGQKEQGILLKEDGRTVAAISDLSVGKKVQVFGNQIDVTTLTIYGKDEYFVKLVK